MKIVLIIFGIIILGAGWYLVSPLFINKTVNEEAPVVVESNATTSIVATGSFTGFDKLHQGSGTAHLIQVDDKLIIRFENDFKVSNGPDLFVGFGKNGQYIKGSEIAELKGNIGSQNYELSIDFDLEKYTEVWIWCKKFSVPFAKAELIKS